MKKTIMLLMALTGVAVGDTMKVTLSPGSTLKEVSGDSIKDNYPFSGEDGYTNDDFLSILNAMEDPTAPGWYVGVGQGGGGHLSDVTFTGDTAFSFVCRSKIEYEYVLAFVEAPVGATALTMSFTSDQNVSASIWAFDTATKNVSLLMGRTLATADTPFSGTVDDLDLGAYDRLVFAWSASAENGTSGAAQISVTDVSLLATVPEPTTATLSLLALAGLAVRRRRK